MASTMLPAPDLLPDVLPTDRLTASGRPVPAVRAELRRIDDRREVLTVAGAWAYALAVVGIAALAGHPLVYAAAVVLMGPAFARFNILGHEAAHRLLFSSKRRNDVVGRWLLAYPALTPLDAYRRGHMAHHKEEFGPFEPDRNFYDGYPVPVTTLRRRLRRDALLVTGWKNLKSLGRAVLAHQQEALRILAVQVVLLGLFALAGRAELYLLLWLLPWMTSWKVLNRLRAIAEHGGMTASPDRRLTTHHVRQSRLASFWLVPYNTGWHLAHHVDIGIPWRNLPQLHDELVASGWVVPDLEYPSYRALWRALASG